ncbi:hypothetical protein SVIOM342S_09965 [Streptomyces violaceorubidus]
MPALGAVAVEGDLRAGFGAAVAGFAVRVDVQVGEVAGAQGDEVAVGAEVGLEVVDGFAVAGHLQLQLARLAGAQGTGEFDLVAVGEGGAVRSRQPRRFVAAGGGQVGAEGEVLRALDGRGEVGEDAVAARRGQVDGSAPGAVGGAGGVQVAVGDQVA